MENLSLARDGDWSLWVALPAPADLGAMRAALPMPQHGWLVPQGNSRAVVAQWRRTARCVSPCKVCRSDRADAIERMLVTGAGSIEDIAEVHGIKTSTLLAHARLHLAPRLSAFGVATVAGQPWKAAESPLAAEGGDTTPTAPDGPVAGGWVERLRADAMRASRGVLPLARAGSGVSHAVSLAIAAGPEDGVWRVGAMWPGIMPAVVLVPEGAHDLGVVSEGGATFGEIVARVVPPVPAGASAFSLPAS